jgi:hypothetical protein
VEILRETPNEFIIYFSKETFVHLCAVSNAMRDIIVLTLRAFCSFALSKSTSMPEIHATITTKRVSPIRQSSQKNVKSLKEEEQEEEEQQQEQQAMYYALPWDTSTSLHSCSTSVSIFDNGIHGGHVHDLGPPVVQEIIYTQEDKALSDLLLQVEALLLHANDTNSQSNTENLSTSASGRYQISIKDIPELEIVDIPSSTSSLGTHSTMICPDLMNSQEEVKIEEEEIKNEFILPVNNQEVEQDKEKEEMNHLKAYYTQVFCALLTQLKTYKRHTNSAKDQIQLLKEQKKDLEKDLKIFQSACCCSSSSSSSTSLDSGWI